MKKATSGTIAINCEHRHNASEHANEHMEKTSTRLIIVSRWNLVRSIFLSIIRMHSRSIVLIPRQTKEQ